MYNITADLKAAVKFQKQNLLLDKFDSNHDLIVCRNVMIYFTEEAKHLFIRNLPKHLSQAEYFLWAAQSKSLHRVNIC